MRARTKIENITIIEFYLNGNSIMKITLIGYGNMGKAIEALAISEGHEIVQRFDSKKPLENIVQFEPTDLAIEFSRPELASKHLRLALQAGIPVICGTTGWLSDKPGIDSYCLQQGGSFLYASNFSIGMNILFWLNRQAARLMENFPGYRVMIEETHHIKKRDAPSGTAISLAEQIIGSNRNITAWHEGSAMSKTSIPVNSIRQGDVKGEHFVGWMSKEDIFTLGHEAYSRDAFASGALYAANWIREKKGVFSFEDIFRELAGIGQ